MSVGGPISGSRDLAPDWRSRSASTLPVAPRRWAHFGYVSSPTTWLMNALIVVVFCTGLMALATTALRLWHSELLAWALPVVGLPVVPPSIVRAPTASAVAQPRSTKADEFEQRLRLRDQQEADARRQAAIKQVQVEDDAIRRAAALEARREREWQAYYKRPADCDPLLNIDSIGCANDYIRARRVFDAQFNSSAGARR